MRNLVEVMRIDRFGNKELHSRAVTDMELDSRVDQRVLRWLDTRSEYNEYHMTRRVLIAEVSDGGYETDRG